VRYALQFLGKFYPIGKIPGIDLQPCGGPNQLRLFTNAQRAI
jgi:hypothetical protein